MEMSCGIGGGGFGERVEPPSADRDAMPVARKRPGERTPDAGAAAGDPDVPRRHRI